MAEAMLKNYDREALAADLARRTLRMKRGVKVLCAKSRKWVPGMLKTVDTSGILVATVLENGRASGEFFTWESAESCLKAIKKELPADFDVRKWTSADWLTPKARAPPKPQAATEKKVKKPAARKPAAGVAARPGPAVEKKSTKKAEGSRKPTHMELLLAATALGLNPGRMSIGKLCKIIRAKINEVDGADDGDAE